MAAEPPGAPQLYPPAELRRRGLARVCDTLLGAAPLAVLVPLSHPGMGAFLAVALSLCNDRLFGPGRSLGKKLFGLRVITIEDRRPADISASAKRNAALALSMIPAASGDLRGLLLSGTALLAVAVAETLTVVAPLQRITNLARLRIGDHAAGTQVIDASIAIGLPAPKPAHRAPSRPVLGAHHRQPPAPAEAPRNAAPEAPPRPSPARPGPGVRGPFEGRPEEPTCASP
jgi:uncharacterized RDD family membrane protein YckC